MFAKFLTAVAALVLLTNVALAEEYVVKSGDTWPGIAQKTLKDPNLRTSLYAANKVKDPNVAPAVGTKVTIPAQLSKNRVAKVKAVSGTVTVDGQKAEAGKTSVKQNSVIITAANSKIDIQLDEGSVVRIGPNTKCTLSSYAYSGSNRNTDLNLGNGSMSMKVTKLSGQSEFKVSTVTAVAGVRGTYFWVNYDAESKEAGIAVYNGAVVVGQEKTDANGKKTIDTSKSASVTAGNAVTVNRDGKPSEVFPIPQKIEWED